MAAQKLADSIRQKYDGQYDYTDPMWGVSRDEKLTLQMGFDIYDSDFTEYTQIVNVYQDAELKHPEDRILSGTRRRKNSRLLLPDGKPEVYRLPVWMNRLRDMIRHRILCLEKGELKDWGNLPRYYMVRYVDTETGDTLDKPVVTVFTVDHEVSRAPKVSMESMRKAFPYSAGMRCRERTNIMS